MTYQVGKTCNISSAEEAAENLMMNWPIKTGAQLLAARLACLDALEGKILCSAAREAFIEAAREAGIYMSGSKGSSSHRLLRGRCNTAIALIESERSPSLAAFVHAVMLKQSGWSFFPEFGSNSHQTVGRVRDI